MTKITSCTARPLIATTPVNATIIKITFKINRWKVAAFVVCHDNFRFVHFIAIFHLKRTSPAKWCRCKFSEKVQHNENNDKTRWPSGITSSRYRVIDKLLIPIFISLSTVFMKMEVWHSGERARRKLFLPQSWSYLKAKHKSNHMTKVEKTKLPCDVCLCMWHIISLPYM